MICQDCNKLILDNETWGSCWRCGKFLCMKCVHWYEGFGNVCLYCFRILEKEKEKK